MDRAGADVETGDTGQVTLRDSPLERAFKRSVLFNRQYQAGLKFRHHWHRAGLSDSIGSVDLNRILSRDVAAYSGMAKTELQAHHRQRYREACRELGMRREYVLSWIICSEETPDKVGAALGWNSRPQAHAAAVEVLRDGLDALAKLWGIE